MTPYDADIYYILTGLACWLTWYALGEPARIAAWRASVQTRRNAEIAEMEERVAREVGAA